MSIRVRLVGGSPSSSTIRCTKRGFDMGRPNLFLLRIHVAFSNEDLKRLAQRTSKKGRSAFIREAVAEKLDALEKEPKAKALR
jgi:hypothetical protein